jgi:hypothetical protein
LINLHTQFLYVYRKMFSNFLLHGKDSNRFPSRFREPWMMENTSNTWFAPFNPNKSAVWLFFPYSSRFLCFLINFWLHTIISEQSIVLYYTIPSFSAINLLCKEREREREYRTLDHLGSFNGFLLPCCCWWLWCWLQPGRWADPYSIRKKCPQLQLFTEVCSLNLSL